jgi:hypothetical protein
MAHSTGIEGKLMLRRIAMGAVAATLLTLALTGCADKTTAGSGAGTSPSPSSGDATAWAEQVCKSVEGDVAKLSESPDVDPADLEKTKANFVAYLADISTTLDNLANGIKDAGPPPVADGGQEVVDQTITTLDDMKKSVDEAKATLEKVSASDPAAFQAAFEKVGEDLTKLGEVQDPTDGLKANKELDSAFDKAPTCQKIDLGSGTSAPTS